MEKIKIKVLISITIVSILTIFSINTHASEILQQVIYNRDNITNIQYTNVSEKDITFDLINRQFEFNVKIQKNAPAMCGAFWNNNIRLYGSSGDGNSLIITSVYDNYKITGIHYTLTSNLSALIADDYSVYMASNSNLNYVDIPKKNYIELKNLSSGTGQTNIAYIAIDYIIETPKPVYKQLLHTDSIVLSEESYFYDWFYDFEKWRYDVYFNLYQNNLITFSTILYYYDNFLDTYIIAGIAETEVYYCNTKYIMVIYTHYSDYSFFNYGFTNNIDYTSDNQWRNWDDEIYDEIRYNGYKLVVSYDEEFYGYYIIDFEFVKSILNNSSGGNNGYNDGYNIGLEIGYNEGYNDGYNQNFENGYNEGIDIGYESGFESGYNDGLDIGYESGYNEGYDIGKNEGYDIGKNEGYKDSEVLASFVPSILGGIIEFFLVFLNLEIAGFSLGKFLLILTAGASIFIVVKMIL